MTDSAYVFDVTVENFQQLVLENSRKVPVLIDFWADWCQPCKTLMPVLAKLAAEYDGAFLLAKVNCDEQQQLAAHLGIRSMPTVKLIKDGQLVDEFTGALPEGQVREFLQRHVGAGKPSVLEQARALRAEGQLSDAVALLQVAQGDDPNNVELAVELAQAHVQLGESDKAEAVLDALPLELRDAAEVKQLKAKLKFLSQAGELPERAVLEQRLQEQPGDAELRFQLAQRAILDSNFQQAMEDLLALMRDDRHYGDDLARKTLVELFDLLGADQPLVKTYRRKLYTLLH